MSWVEKLPVVALVTPPPTVVSMFENDPEVVTRLTALISATRMPAFTCMVDGPVKMS